MFGDNYITTNHDVEIRYDCPFCIKRRGKPDHDGKLYVNIVKGKYICFKCNARGRLFNERSIDISGDVYGDILKMYNNGDSIDNDTDDPNTFFIPNIKINKGTLAYEYLISRGFTDEIIDYYDLRLGIDDLFGRIVIPNVIYGDRGIFTDMYSARSYINQEPKYRNPVKAVKTRSVFNLHRIDNNCDEIIILEGAITAIFAGKSGVATYGCHPSDYQIDEILSKNPKSLICAYDGDSAGRNGARDLLHKVKSRGYDNLYYVNMPNGVDAADMGEEVFKEYVRKNKMSYINDLYRDLYILPDMLA